MAKKPNIDCDAIHKALANPVRREILAWLKDPQTNFPDQEHPLNLGVCAGQIDHRCGLSQSTVSAHLASLQKADLITARKVGQWIYYSRNETTIHTFLTAINGDL
ncbi:MAG: transcriptional regulator, ArsR family [Herbaspirillum sp.]|jgi:DNA-binding transcriptional ArsR family regulator|nr:transcriptional regulator, ArsR family [Herbaspirillum sp.]